MGASWAWRKRNEPDCPNGECSVEDFVKESDGRVVCACGIVVQLDNICDVPSYTATGEVAAVRKRDPVADSSPLKRLKEWHPACEPAALSFARQLTVNYTKGMTKGERIRHTQVLAFLAYKDDAQGHVSLASLAASIGVPEERLSKDVKNAAQAIGIKAWLPQNDFGDETEALGRAVVTLVKPHMVKRGAAGVRDMNRWCKKTFTSAAEAGEVDLVNYAPKYQARGAIAVYCERMGSPFQSRALCTPKRKRDGQLEDECVATVRYLTANQTAASVAAILRKYAEASAHKA